MKRIILSVVVMAFAVAAQASDAKPSQSKDNKDKPSCCSSKMKTSEQANGACPFSKTACCKAVRVKQTVLLSPKAADSIR